MDPNDQNPMGPSQDQGTPAPSDDQSGQAGDMPQAPTEVPPPGPSEEELPPPPPAQPTEAPDTSGDQSSQ